MKFCTHHHQHRSHVVIHKMTEFIEVFIVWHTLILKQHFLLLFFVCFSTEKKLNVALIMFKKKLLALHALTCQWQCVCKYIRASAYMLWNNFPKSMQSWFIIARILFFVVIILSSFPLMKNDNVHNNYNVYENYLIVCM